MRTLFVRLVALLLLACTGCSAVFVRGPVADNVAGDCTPQSTAPTADAALAVVGGILAGVGGALMATKTDGEGNGWGAVMFGIGMLGVGGVMLIANGISAGYGFSATSRCRDALAQRQPQTRLTPAQAQEAAQAALRTRPASGALTLITAP